MKINMIPKLDGASKEFQQSILQDSKLQNGS